MTDGRAHAPRNGTEVETLLGFLDHHRDTLRLKTDGLDAAQLSARLAPSTMTLGGLLKHMAWVEDWWFGQSLAGKPESEVFAEADWEADGDWEWTSAAGQSPEELREIFDGRVAASDEIIAAALPQGLDQPMVRVSPRGTQPSMRWILVHMIEEYARHNGHADLLRESIDGAVGA